MEPKRLGLLRDLVPRFETIPSRPISRMLEHHRPLGLRVLIEPHAVPCASKRCGLAPFELEGGEGGAQIE
jgi:hypothetical protein